MTKPVKLLVPSGTFGFSFRMRANGLGGTFPKTYVVDGSNAFLLGFTSEFSPAIFLGWPSDPGDSPFPTFARDYGPANGGVVADGLCPNNVRLSQIPLTSIAASYGIGVGAQINLPSSTNFDDPNLETSPGAANTLGDFGSIRKIRLRILDSVAPGPRVLINGGFVIGGAIEPVFEVETSNLGSITVVNLTPGTITVGVTAELDL